MKNYNKRFLNKTLNNNNNLSLELLEKHGYQKKIGLSSWEVCQFCVFGPVNCLLNNNFNNFSYDTLCPDEVYFVYDKTRVFKEL